MTDEVDLTNLSSNEIREIAKAKSLDKKLSNQAKSDEIRELNIAANNKKTEELLAKNPNHIIHKITDKELQEVLDYIINKNYSVSDAWDKMASRNRRHPDWLNKVKNKTCYMEVKYDLNFMERAGNPTIILMKKYGTFDLKVFVKASTNNSLMNKIRKAIDKALKEKERIEKMEQQLIMKTEQVKRKDNQIIQLSKTITEQDKYIVEIENRNKKLEEGILISENFNWKEEAVRMRKAGMKIIDIALKLNKNRRTISRYFHSDEGKKLLR